MRIARKAIDFDEKQFQRLRRLSPGLAQFSLSEPVLHGTRCPGPECRGTAKNVIDKFSKPGRFREARSPHPSF